jgi:branched-chain amino acid transport system permease protein
VQWTAPILFIVVIGGIGTLEGPIIGAVLYWWFKDQFIDQANWYSIAIGVVAVVVGLALQKGIWGYLRRYTGDLFPIARRLQSPLE